MDSDITAHKITFKLDAAHFSSEAHVLLFVFTDQSIFILLNCDFFHFHTDAWSSAMWLHHNHVWTYNYEHPQLGHLQISWLSKILFHVGKYYLAQETVLSYNQCLKYDGMGQQCILALP